MEATFKAVILHGFSNEEALALMRAVRQSGGAGAGAAFATTTPTSIGWKVEDLLEHLEEEHRLRLAALEARRMAAEAPDGAGTAKA